MNTLFELPPQAPPKPVKVKYYLWYETSEGKFIYWKKLRRGYEYGSKWLQPHEIKHGRKIKLYATQGIAENQRTQLQKHMPPGLMVNIGMWDVEANKEVVK